MNKHLLYNSIIIVLLGINLTGFSQVSHGGAPISFDQNFTNLIKTNIPTVTMPEFNVEKLKAEDLENDLFKDRPWRFGQNITVNYNLSNSGTWDYLPNGSRIWRLRIFSPGALSINLIFDNYKLPAGATLFIYNQNHSHVIGSFTSANNQADHVFATTLVRGDAVTIEYFEPANPEFLGKLSLSNVTHGYRGPEDFAEKAFGSSGSCNVNVACPQAAGWEDQIRSACMLVSGGSGFCSGALINNTNNDGTPYVLTADHCYSNPSSWVFWFNWQSPTCSNPGSSPSYQSISGAVLKARNSASDFCLVQMNSTPPSNYNVYYSGWNRTTDQSITGTIWGIHHPSGDIKKISWTTLGVTTTTYLQNPVPGDGTHWRITNWSDGTTTEGGSSGSPLYDPNHRIIGQLHGGYASCTSITSDWYGKLGISWTGGGTSTTMLQPWLDPAGTNPTFIDGFDPNTPAASLDAALNGIIEPINSYCGPENVTPAIIIRNSGSTTLTTLTASYNFDGGANVVQNWTGSLNTYQTDTIYFPSILTTSGTHVMNSHIYSPNGSTDENLINDTSSTNFVVGNLLLPTGVGASSCLPASLTLSATGSGELHWFDSPTGGNDLGTGNTYITPLITNTTTYYVEDHIINPTQFVGPTNNTSGGGTNTGSGGLVFDAFTPIKIVSVSVNNTGAAGNKLVSLKNSSGTTIQSATINVPAGVSRITLNFDVPTGTNYQLTGPTNSGLYRLNSGVTYPYTINGLVSITTSTATTTPQNFYYFFFDWEVKEQDCISGRVPVVASIGAQVTPTISINASSTAICPGDAVTFTATTTFEGITPTYQWQQNGVNVGQNNSTLTLSSINDNDEITCILISSESCASINNITSNLITISVGNNSPTSSFTYTQNGLDFIFTNTSTGATSYLWDFGDGTTSTAVNPSHSYAVSGNYIVTLTVTNNCGSDNILQSVNAIGSEINSNILNSGVNIFPNPTVGMVNISFSKSVNNGKVIIEDYLGQIVFENRFEKGINSLKIDLTNLSDGLYLIRVQTIDRDFIYKILKEK